MTQSQSVSNDRAEQEKKANYELIAQTTVMNTAKMAKQGNYREAQAYAKLMSRKMKKNACESSNAEEARGQMMSNFNNLY